MKNTLLLIGYTLLLIGCKQATCNDGHLYDSNLPREIQLNDETNKFISDFIQSKSNADCIYEFYVDKKAEDEYFLTLFNIPNDTNYFTKHFPVNYALVENKIVFVYSGVEDFIKKENYSSNVEIIEKKIRESASYETISKVVKRDTSYIVGAIGIPFSDIKFTPPIIVVD
jgi:hypothetical protein